MAILTSFSVTFIFGDSWFQRFLLIPSLDGGLLLIYLLLSKRDPRIPMPKTLSYWKMVQK